MRTLFTLLLTILLITGFGSCYKCNEKPYLDINWMDITTTHYDWGPYIPENHPVSYDSLVIRARFGGSFYGKSNKIRSFSFLSSAIAMDCDDGRKGSKETVESIAVIALTNYDHEYSAGDTLNDIINIHDYRPAVEVNLSQYLTEIKPGIDMYGLVFHLARKPTEKVVQFRVAVNLTNGEKYSGETIPITIRQ